MTSAGGVPRKQLIVAAVLAGAAGLALVAAGWWLRDWQHRTDWDRLSDGDWWAGAAVQMLGYLAFGKAGFKVALGAVIGVVALSTWVRRRSKPADPDGRGDRAQIEDGRGDRAETEDGRGDRAETEDGRGDEGRPPDRRVSDGDLVDRRR